MVMPVRIGMGLVSACAGFFLAVMPCVASSSSGAMVSTVPILMYHHIRPLAQAPDKAGRALSVSPEKFRAQMRQLEDAGYRTIRLDALARIAKRGRPVRQKLAVVTFDDGYDDAFKNAFSILRERKQVGVFFLPTALIGTPGYLTEDQVKVLSGSGMEIGSHTVHHSALVKVTQADLLIEMHESRATLRALTKKGITSISYPYGDVDEWVRHSAEMAGYITAVTVRPGIATFLEDYLLLPRLKMGEKTDLSRELK